MQEGGVEMGFISGMLQMVIASVIAHRICKWLDGRKKKDDN